MEKAPAPMSLSQSGIVPTWIDKGADPCQDFFAYACDGFTKTAEIPADRSSWGAIQLVVKDNEEFLRKVLEDAAASTTGDPIAVAVEIERESLVKLPSIGSMNVPCAACGKRHTWRMTDAWIEDEWRAHMVDAA